MKKRSYRKAGPAMEVRIDTEQEFSILMGVNFPTVKPGNVPGLACGRCMQFRQGACAGEQRVGYEVIQCMFDHFERGEMGVILPSMN